MATYLFQCKDCDHQQNEAFAMGTAPADVRCNNCGGPAVRRYTPPATVIK